MLMDILTLVAVLGGVFLFIVWADEESRREW
jgi:hypothetical protein